MIKTWFQKGDLSFKAFKKRFSAYKNEKLNKLKGTIGVEARFHLNLLEYLDNDRIKELVSAKYPSTTELKQLWKAEKEIIEIDRKAMKKTLTKKCKFLKKIKGDSIYKLNPYYGAGDGTMYKIVNLLTSTEGLDKDKMLRLSKILNQSSLVVTNPEVGTFLDGEAKKVWDDAVKKAYGDG